MERVKAAGPTLKGIDVFHGDTVSSFSGNAFVFLKSSEGTSIKDPAFAARWAELKTAGIPRGAYHFFRPELDAVTQAEDFYSVVGPLQAGDLPPVLDVEVLDGLSDPAASANVRACLGRMGELFGRHPIVYGSPYFLEDLGLPSSPSALWVAEYGVSAPFVPPPWAGWMFWQYTGTGVDRNYFNGDAAALAAFIAGSKAPTAPEAVAAPISAPAPVTSSETPWMDWMRANKGQVEKTGAAATSFDLMVFSHTDDDDVARSKTMEAGCAATACAALELTGYKSPHNAAAISFKEYGTACDLKPGCVMVWQWAGGDHHVDFCDVIVSDTLVTGIGGNQSHKLQDSTYERQYLVATRWPVK